VTAERLSEYEVANVMTVALVFNAGSSSLKIAAYRLDPGQPVQISRGILRSGTKPQLEVSTSSAKEVVDLEPGASLDKKLIRDLIGRMLPPNSTIEICGHRIVHGGPTFHKPVLLDQQTISEIEKLGSFAPLHIPPALEVIHAVKEDYPDVLQTASFDTAFHSSLCDLASRFAIPASMHEQGLRRYGFHGLSYKHVASELATLDPDLAKGRVICAHLGSGASLCGMVEGVSIDTSMGFSALDGVPMATRPGSLDPGVLLHLLRNNFAGADELEDFLYHKCGLLGVSGRSGDIRDLLDDFHPASQDAVDLFCFRIAGEVGRLAVSLGGIDALIFTAGIGEHQPDVRSRIIRHLSWLGITLSEAANRANATIISTKESGVAALVVPTDEEKVIVQESIQAIAEHRLEVSKHA
jgi:acetate kinase